IKKGVKSAWLEVNGGLYAIIFLASRILLGSKADYWERLESIDGLILTGCIVLVLVISPFLLFMRWSDIHQSFKIRALMAPLVLSGFWFFVPMTYLGGSLITVEDQTLFWYTSFGILGVLNQANSSIFWECRPIVRCALFCGIAS
ncbi:MAG: hypothetical protein ACXADX_12850, partial [Candidatus Hodarchaeales archaeon]